MTRGQAFRISINNATILSAFYLVVGIGVEVLRRLFGFQWAIKASLAMEAFPAQILRVLGILEPLKQAYGRGQLDELWIRVLYGAVSVAIIYLLGLVVGLMLYAVASRASRPAVPEEPPR